MVSFNQTSNFMASKETKFKFPIVRKQPFLPASLSSKLTGFHVSIKGKLWNQIELDCLYNTHTHKNRYIYIFFTHINIYIY